MFILININVQSQTKVNFLFDKSTHLVGEIERVDDGLYAKVALEYAPNIEGGYTVVGASVGYSKDFGMFENFRFYTAPKIQFIRRGGYTHPSFGAELGFDNISDGGFIIGIRGTYDYRTDFDFWGGSAELRPSVFIKIGFEL